MGGGGLLSLASPPNTEPAGGGGGGGAVELGAVGAITLAGSVWANGGVGGSSFYAGGGDAGGGILVHAPTVTLSGALDAIGGASSPALRLGGGGGGGRILILTADGTLANGSLYLNVDVSGATINVRNPGQPGVKNVQLRYPCTGFFQPVDNLPTLNTVKAGQSLPVKFSLGGNYGLTILAAGSPTSQQIACPNGAPVDAIEEVVTSNSGLQYDATTDTYTYVWQTQKAWAGQCRQLSVTLSDGTTHLADFQLK